MELPVELLEGDAPVPEPKLELEGEVVPSSEDEEEEEEGLLVEVDEELREGISEISDEFEGEPVLYNGVYECMVVVGVAEAAEAAADEVVLAGDVELPDSVELRFEEA